ncbi:MAG: lysozyme inhibitor LprI family protein [Acinetobacter sp.]|uniref:lysozyme inhibitor LprI family protein n=1 Tax=Acinetobacter sp. TaxID=472 RepID=UPI00282B0E3B|nr:lysozyme inhibitor LprI family protein [Acinetobacter sp.]MDR2061948.1 lysozyme inhibitor LprI family protein [Acinetobacter sp.]
MQRNDKELNSVYKSKISKLSQNEKEKLKASQRNWVKKKEKLCMANEDEFGRESHFEAIACQTEMTKERISFLRKY